MPAEGRKGDPPAWPLDDTPTDREWATWTQFWAKPQAVIWERDQIVEPVAMFVRQYLEGMGRKASAENRKTVRLMFADLYLTSDSLLRARLRIATDEVEEKRSEKAAEEDSPAPASARDRLTVVDGSES